METTGFGGSSPEQNGTEPSSAPASTVTAFAPSPLDPEWRPESEGSASPANDSTPASAPEAAPAPAHAVAQPAAAVAVPSLAPATPDAPPVEAPSAPAAETTGTSITVSLAPMAEVSTPAPLAEPVEVPAQPEAATLPTATPPSEASPDGVALAETEAFEGAYGRATTEEQVTDADLNLHDLLGLVLEKNASDLHLTTGSRPQIRLHGHLTPLEDYPELTPSVIQRVMYAAITQRQREKFEENLELDFAYSVPGKARFRVNLYRQRDSLGAAFRLIPFEIKKLEDLGIPPSVANFAMMARGFVLVTGPTGSGKSTTLAALVDLANRQRRDHIMTVEDPIEFLHTHQSCVVNQREVGEDTHSFENALKHVLRQDPDIILVGEMRDLETISVALTAAETGHLVFATLHTQDAASDH